MQIMLAGCLIFCSNWHHYNYDKPRSHPVAKPRDRRSLPPDKQHRSPANEDSPEHPSHSAPNGRTPKRITPHPLPPYKHGTDARAYSRSTQISHPPTRENSHAPQSALPLSFPYSETSRLPCRNRRTSKIVFPNGHPSPHSQHQPCNDRSQPKRSSCGDQFHADRRALPNGSQATPSARPTTGQHTCARAVAHIPPIYLQATALPAPSISTQLTRPRIRSISFTTSC